MTQAIADPFAVKYSRPEGSKVPTGRHIQGRLVAVVPTGTEPVKVVPNDKGEPGAMQKRLTADVIVCDGGVIWYGGDVNTPGSDNVQMPSPCVIPSMWLFGEALIDWIMDASLRGVALGRMVKKTTKTGNKTYWTMDAPSPEDRSLALPLYMKYKEGTLFTEANLPPVGAPVQAAPQFSANPAPQWPAAQPGVVAQPMTPGVNPFQLPAAPPPPLADWTLAEMPASFTAAGGTPDQWAGADQQTRVSFLAQQGITGPGQRPTGL